MTARGRPVTSLEPGFPLPRAGRDVVIAAEAAARTLETQQSDQDTVRVDDRQPPTSHVGHRLSEGLDVHLGTHRPPGETTVRARRLPRSCGDHVRALDDGQENAPIDHQHGVDVVVLEGLPTLGDGGAGAVHLRTSDHRRQGARNRRSGETTAIGKHHATTLSQGVLVDHRDTVMASRKGSFDLAVRRVSIRPIDRVGIR